MVAVSGVVAAGSVVTVGLLATAPAAFGAPLCSADSPTVSSYAADQAGTFTVPANVTKVSIVASGGQGAGSAIGPAAGGAGATVTSVVTATPADVLTVDAGQAGAAGGTGGGSGGAPSGGSAPPFAATTGTGGGGASLVWDGSTLLIAAGGGGGSGYGPADDSGGAAASGASSQSAGAVSAGANGNNSFADIGPTAGAGGGGGTSTPGAGGAVGQTWSGSGSAGAGEVGGDGATAAGSGGGGFAGGGGGGMGSFSGAGGAGSSYALNAYSIAPNDGDGSVTISYEAPSVTSAATATFPAQQAGSFTVCTSAVPTATIAEAGALPTGVSYMDNGDGTATLSGTPAAGTEGSYPLTFTADNGNDPQATQDFTLTVGQDTPAVALSGSPTSMTFGQSVTFTAQITGVPSGSAPTGTVDFTDNDVSIRPACDAAAVSTTAGVSTATCTTSGLTAGSHPIAATYSGDTDYASGQVSTDSYLVVQAATMTAVSVQPSTLTVVVNSVSPGSGTPTGSVAFSVDGTTVGTASLAAGTATLTDTVSAGKSRNIAALYSGDTNFTGSSASTSRSDPIITASVSSAHAKTQFGWYRSAVTVRFTCATNGAPLTAPCPSAVTFASNGGGHSVTRSITATNGGAATVVVNPINIDRVKPHVRVTGVRNHARYRGAAPKPGCAARDRPSGIASCAISTSRPKSRSFRSTSATVHFTARATDKAGNVATLRGSYRVASFLVKRASFSHGAFTVRIGHRYTVSVVSKTRPRFYKATPTRTAMSTLSVKGPRMHRAGHGVWTTGLTITRQMRHHRLWKIGAKTKGVMRVVTIRLTS